METPKRVWAVHSADTGKSFEVHLENEATVEILQLKLAEISGIGVRSQVLINESGINVRTGMRLTSPRHQAPIFLFDLRAITSPEPSRRGSVDLPTLLEPTNLADASQQQDGEKASQLAKMLQARADQVYECTKQNIAEQTIMARALMSARANLVGHAAHFCKKFSAFNEDLSNSFKQYDQILASCDTGFEALEKVPMPPELLGEASQVGSTSMSESTVVQNMQSIRSYVAGALQQLKGRFSELSVTNMETSARLEVHMEMTELDPTQGSHFAKLEEQITQSSGLRAAQLELCEDPANLQTMYSNDAKLHKIMRLVFTAQVALQQEAHTRMQHISTHQSQIQKMAKSISGYKDSLQSLDRYFSELEHVPHISAAFEAGLTEVRRRAQFRDAYAAHVLECTQTINSLVEREVGVRKAFAKSHGRHLPPMLIPGMAEMPPTINIEVPLFDNDLPCLEDKGDVATPKLQQDHEPGLPEGAAPESEGGRMSPTSEIAALKATLETVRQERDAIQQSMLEAHFKVSTQESQIKSIDEVRMNNSSLEVQLAELKATLSRTSEALEARSHTLNEVRQIIGMASSGHSVTTSGCSSQTSTSDSQHDSALLELLRSQRRAAEGGRNERDALELKGQLEAAHSASISMGEFKPGDVMCFLRRKPSQLAGCTETDIYEAIGDHGPTSWFLHPVSRELLSEEKPRVVVGQMTEQELQLVDAAPGEGGEGTPFGLPQGSEYHCVKLKDVKAFI